MTDKISPIISIRELKELQKAKSVILVDSSNIDRDTFRKIHLKGAIYVDINLDLAEIKNPKNGGRHPLPTVDSFVRVLRDLGISNDSHVVIYDENSGAFASRMWWMLRSIGHAKVQVLDGGFENAMQNDFPTECGDPKKPKKGDYEASVWNWPLVNINDIDQARQNPNKIVIDVRSAERFKGDFEPIDLIAGHIPGAVNIPFSTNLNSDGVFLPFEDLTKKYADINSKYDEVIFHCGSGVTACHGILAMEICGFKTPSLYVGSWSEWSRNDLPVGKSK